jgi:hypothetical protein
MASATHSSGQDELANGIPENHQGASYMDVKGKAGGDPNEAGKENHVGERQEVFSEQVVKDGTVHQNTGSQQGHPIGDTNGVTSSHMVQTDQDQRQDETERQDDHLDGNEHRDVDQNASFNIAETTGLNSQNSATSSMNMDATQTRGPENEVKKEPRGDRLVIDGVETSYDIEPHEMISILEREMRLADLTIKLNYKMMSAGGLVNEAAARIIYMSSLVDLTNLIIEQSETLKKHLEDTGTMITTTMNEIEKLRT